MYEYRQKPAWSWADISSIVHLFLVDAIKEIVSFEMSMIMEDGKETFVSQGIKQHCSLQSRKHYQSVGLCAGVTDSDLAPRFMREMYVELYEAFQNSIPTVKPKGFSRSGIEYCSCSSGNCSNCKCSKIGIEVRCNVWCHGGRNRSSCSNRLKTRCYMFCQTAKDETSSAQPSQK